MNSNIEVWLWLLLVLLPHNPRTSEILSTYGSALEAAKAMRDGNCPLLKEAEKIRVERTRTREVRSLMSECDRLGIRIITMDDPKYPDKLRGISDPPIVLFVKGTLEPLNRTACVSVVGPRQPSEYGRKICDRFCSEMARDKISLISGLAVGIDAAVHRCAINNNGYTVGVLGCGIMVNYPAENEELKLSIINSGGAIISELLPYTSVTSAYFKQRNRIISGLSAATLVIEASSRSGCLLTAEHTMKQVRALLCVPPHDVLDERFEGSATLLRAGAKSACSIADIYNGIRNSIDSDEYNIQTLIEEKNQKRAANPVTRNKHIRSADETKPAVAPETVPKTEPDMSALSPEEAEVISLLKERPLTMDEIIEKTNRKYDEVCSIILGLELMDAVVRGKDGIFTLA